ncbi:VOC family protein [Leptospira interrogans]|uniref:VOC family protein n=1 Tax=Leptospira interrogans TaxID=173 RepID=UPI000773A4B9|nr:VOC family protein [Leptospira interrogans]
MIHHIAIGSPNIETLEKFYESLPGLKKIRINKNTDQSIRSIWFIAGDTILMLEIDNISKGPKALIFSASDLKPEDLGTLPDWIQETEYTKYFKDPDGNLLGYSSYPNPWPF